MRTYKIIVLLSTLLYTSCYATPSGYLCVGLAENTPTHKIPFNSMSALWQNRHLGSSIFWGLPVSKKIGGFLIQPEIVWNRLAIQETIIQETISTEAPTQVFLNPGTMIEPAVSPSKKTVETSRINPNKLLVGLVAQANHSFFSQNTCIFARVMPFTGGFINLSNIIEPTLFLEGGIKHMFSTEIYGIFSGRYINSVNNESRFLMHVSIGRQFT